MMDEWIEREFPWRVSHQEFGGDPHTGACFCSCYQLNDLNNPPSDGSLEGQMFCFIVQSGYFFTVQCSVTNFIRQLSPDELKDLEMLTDDKRSHSIKQLRMEAGRLKEILRYNNDCCSFHKWFIKNLSIGTPEILEYFSSYGTQSSVDEILSDPSVDTDPDSEVLNAICGLYSLYLSERKDL